MAGPYSTDLRERAVGAMVAAVPGDGECCGREDGRPSAAACDRRACRHSWRAAQGDFTLRGLVADLAGRGLKVDGSGPSFIMKV